MAVTETLELDELRQRIRGEVIAGGDDAYEAAPTALREDTQAWWAPSRRPDTDVAAEDDAAVVAMAYA